MEAKGVSPPMDESKWAEELENVDAPKRERHIKIISFLLLSKEFQERERQAIQEEAVDGAKRDFLRQRLLLAKGMREENERQLEDQMKGLAKQYEQIKAYVIKELQEIKPMALKHVVNAFEASLAKNQKKAYGLKVEEEEEEEAADNDSDKDNGTDAAGSDEIRLGDELADGPSTLGASPLPKSPKPPTPAKRRAADAFGLLDGDFQREVATAVRRSALRKKMEEEEAEQRAAEQRDMKARWQEEMQAQVARLREEVANEFKAQMQDERDQAHLMATVECELAQQEREAALERRIRSEYEERIRDIMQAAGLA